MERTSLHNLHKLSCSCLCWNHNFLLQVWVSYDLFWDKKICKARIRSTLILWKYSNLILLYFHFGGLPFLSSSIFVIFYFGLKLAKKFYIFSSNILWLKDQLCCIHSSEQCWWNVSEDVNDVTGDSSIVICTTTCTKCDKVCIFNLAIN